MRALSAADIIRVWETGRAQPAAARAVTVLSAVLPDETQAALAELSIGKRDGRLLAVREQAFGATIDATTSCPKCREELEFCIDVASLRQSTPAETGTFCVHVAEIEIDCRLPNSADLLSVAGCGDAQKARAALVHRCTQASSDAVSALDANAFEALAAALSHEIEQRDPQADIELTTTCAACGHEWTVIFDIAQYLWAEISARATQLLDEVHVLASAYGWSEADILALPDRRRRAYVGRVA
jgi:hypothetical protein